jgi:putative transposase
LGGSCNRLLAASWSGPGTSFTEVRVHRLHRGMPWMETNAKEQRRSFVRDYGSGQWSVSELCQRYSITRPTGYKWLERYAEAGDEGLEENSRAPRTCPHQTAPAIERQILALRAEYGWGAKKLLQVLSRRHPGVVWPARSTVNAILDRHGKLRRNRRRRRWSHPGAVALETQRPNQVWPADFKGQFKTLDGRYCFPLTVTDHYSRKLLVCRGLPSVRTEGANPLFLRLFREVGLPEAIRTDNGVPFASTGIHGLCQLNVWWMKLGIVHQRIRPSSPQENGQHERMHQDLKREAARPPAANLAAQQRKLESFRRRYNEERPHDGIGGALPDERWTPSPRAYPECLRPPEYPSHFEVRRVSAAGTFRLKAKQPFLSNALADESIGLEEVGDGIWSIVYYETLLGRIDERSRTITGV